VTTREEWTRTGSRDSLDGESDATERARTLSELAALPPDELDGFADVLRPSYRENEQKRPALLPDEQP
jgi:hypothetical protein